MVQLTRFLVLIYLGLGGSASALDEGTDLQSAGKLARQRGVPVMVVFSARHCEYCERLQNEHVDPMLLQAEYREHLVVLRVTVDRPGDIRDFAGVAVPPDEFANRYAVQITPTVIFFDDQGRMLTKKLEGYTNPAFYGYYLDDAIAIARGKLNAKSPPAQRL
ncbi:MAG: thioredoxin fold domain-containing protein [Pseudomonadota bacterium]